MASLKDLLKYKEKVEIKNQSGKTLKSVWIRLLGDEDLTRAYKLARVASTDKRAALTNPDTIDFKDEVAILGDFPRQDLIDVIKQSNQNKFTSEAFVKVNREEAIKLEDIAVEPDAPTLEEQELMDKKIQDQEDAYQKKIDEYVELRLSELAASLESKSDEEVLKMAQKEYSNILPLQTFMSELSAQKVFLGTFQDEACKTQEFESVHDFKNAHPYVKEQLVNAYNSLEISPDDIKN